MLMTSCGSQGTHGGTLGHYALCTGSSSFLVSLHHSFLLYTWAVLNYRKRHIPAKDIGSHPLKIILRQAYVLSLSAQPVRNVQVPICVKFTFPLFEILLPTLPMTWKSRKPKCFVGLEDRRGS